MIGDSGSVGALLLSEQLSTYRFLDRLRRVRNGPPTVTIVEQGSAELRQRYDRLVAAYNKLAREREVEIQALEKLAERYCDQTIALKGENNRLAAELQVASGELERLRELRRKQ